MAGNASSRASVIVRVRRFTVGISSRRSWIRAGRPGRILPEHAVDDALLHDSPRRTSCFGLPSQGPLHQVVCRKETAAFVHAGPGGLTRVHPGGHVDRSARGRPGDDVLREHLAEPLAPPFGTDHEIVQQHLVLRGPNKGQFVCDGCRNWATRFADDEDVAWPVAGQEFADGDAQALFLAVPDEAAEVLKKRYEAGNVRGRGEAGLHGWPRLTRDLNPAVPPPRAVGGLCFTRGGGARAPAWRRP